VYQYKSIPQLDRHAIAGEGLRVESSIGDQIGLAADKMRVREVDDWGMEHCPPVVL
jgi:hypothetical protein